jgi:hypothetical protein
MAMQCCAGLSSAPTAARSTVSLQNGWQVPKLTEKEKKTKRKAYA